MTRAVIFDLDGLLLDSEILSYRAYREMLRGCGCEFSVEEYVQTYCGRIEEKNIAHLIETYGLPLSFPAGLEKYLRIEKGLLDQGVELKRGARELLSFLSGHGYRLALASSSTRDRAMDMLAAHGIADRFDAFVFAEDIGRGKPAPDVFLRACEELGEEPGACLVLEDSEAGIQAADAAGIPVICIPDMKRPGRPFLERTAAVLESLDQVIGYLTDEMT